MPHGTMAPRLRILLAEEHVATRDLVALALGRAHRVDSVTTGREALARAARDRPELIVLSATLSDIPGAELIGALRRLPGLGRVPILALSPQGGAGLGRACVAAGATAHLARPLDSTRLLGEVEQLLRPGSDAAAPEPALDLAHLRTFTGGDPQLEGELSDLFLSTAATYLHGMHEALARGRPWASIAHALKGASGNLGARRLATLARLAEGSAPDRAQLDALAHALEEVRASFARRV